MNIDRVSVALDDNGEWWLEFYVDDVRYGVSVNEIAAQQSVQRTCAHCGADDWRDAIVPDTLEICNRCGASR